jgi:hypothetical protein
MPQKPVRRRAGTRYTPATPPAFKPRLIADWAGCNAAVAERGDVMWTKAVHRII